MDWADVLSQRVRDAGPQVVNDSKTPSGTVHVGSLRGPVILDAITRALRANGIQTTLLYGVDDLDPMDAQALLTPDAVDHAVRADGGEHGGGVRGGGGVPVGRRVTGAGRWVLEGRQGGSNPPAISAQ